MNMALAIDNKQADQAEKLNEEQWQAFLLVFHKTKHAGLMSSYVEDFALLWWVGVNIGCAY